MTTKMSTNGQARKSLSEQIDRLDAMLDGLADGLNDAVADAVKGAVGMAVREAIQAVVREALASPELLARLAAVAPAAEAPDCLNNAATTIGRKPPWPTAFRWLAAWLAAASEEGGRWLECVKRLATRSWAQLRTLGRYRKQFGIAAGVGMVVGAASYFAGPWFGAAITGLGGFAGATAVQAALGLHHLVGGRAADI